MHTNWTDGAHSAGQMHQAAIEAGLTQILFSEHARKTSGDWFPRFAAEVRALPKGECQAWVGVETKIEDFEGTLDVAEDIRSRCELIMGSVHRFPGEVSIDKANPPEIPAKQVLEIEFELSRAAVRAERIDILGHPFGMSLRRFGVDPPKELIEELAKECAIHGVAFEINSRYHPEPWRFVEICQNYEAPISLGSNAHHCGDVGGIVNALRNVYPT